MTSISHKIFLFFIKTSVPGYTLTHGNFKYKDNDILKVDQTAQKNNKIIYQY